MSSASPVIAYVDTNCIRSELGPDTGALKRLGQHGKDGAVELYIHRIVIEEVVTGKTQELMKCFKDLRVSGRSLEWFPNGSREKFENAINEYIPEDEKLLEIVRDKFDQWISEARAKIIEISHFDTIKCFDQYFSGKPPFKSIKNRNDIPDSYIYNGFTRLIYKPDNKYFVVCADEKLAESFAHLSGVSVFKTIGEFLRDPEIIAKIQEYNNSNKSTDNYNLELAFMRENAWATIDRSEEQIKSDLSRQVFKALEGMEITQAGLPSDNSDATVTGIGEITIEFNRQQIFELDGSQINFEAIARIDTLHCDLYIYKGDYYGLDEDKSSYIYVFDHDWNKHYVAAEITCPALAKCSVRINFDQSEYGILSVEAVYLEDIEDVELLLGQE